MTDPYRPPPEQPATRHPLQAMTLREFFALYYPGMLAEKDEPAPGVISPESGSADRDAPRRIERDNGARHGAGEDQNGT